MPARCYAPARRRPTPLFPRPTLERTPAAIVGTPLVVLERRPKPLRLGTVLCLWPLRSARPFGVEKRDGRGGAGVKLAHDTIMHWGGGRGCSVIGAGGGGVHRIYRLPSSCQNWPHLPRDGGIIPTRCGGHLNPDNAPFSRRRGEHIPLSQGGVHHAIDRAGDGRHNKNVVSVVVTVMCGILTRCACSCL